LVIFKRRKKIKRKRKEKKQKTGPFRARKVLGDLKE
jgi:hypothetical protein